MDKLKFIFLRKNRCPLCGSRVKWYKEDKWYYIKCANPYCFIHLTYPSGTLKGAVHDWNHNTIKEKALLKSIKRDNVRRNRKELKKFFKDAQRLRKNGGNKN